VAQKQRYRSGATPQQLEATLRWAKYLDSLDAELSADRGDASVVLAIGRDAGTQVFATALTANRTVTVPLQGAWNGLRYTVVRPATGAFTLTVQDPTPTTLKVLAAGQWVTVGCDGTAYRALAFGSL
jgi:hypothetical protein